MIFEDFNQTGPLEQHCQVNLYGMSSKQWILGAPFLSDYYQVYDIKRSQMGLVPSAYVNDGYPLT
jgi:hypothetical protein